MTQCNFQSPKQDLIEKIRSSLSAQFDADLRSERAKWEKHVEALQQQHKEALAHVRHREKGKLAAEQQVRPFVCAVPSRREQLLI
jgi:hypothetical protein